MIRVKREQENGADPAAARAVPDAQQQPKLSLSDEIRQRIAERRMGHNPPELAPVGGGPFLFCSKGDLVLFGLILIAVYFVVLVKHDIDLAKVAWVQYLSPNYDEDHWL